MLINGRVRQACSALVDRLLEDQPEQIELRPMGKFPVIRDLVVDRRRLFRALEKLQCWIPVDGYHDMGSGPRQSSKEQQQAYPLSECMSCGCCLEACPQYIKVELRRQDNESNEDFENCQNMAFDRVFIGVACEQPSSPNELAPHGRQTAHQRLDALTAEGGIQNCGKAANCQAVCPKGIPLMTSWGRAGRAVTVHAIKQFFDG